MVAHLHHHIVVDIDVVVDVVDGVVLDVAVVYVVDVQPVVVNTVANNVVFLGILMSYDDRIRIFRNDLGPLFGSANLQYLQLLG